eukprot:3932277-Rhodomonas_salina.2
MRLRNSPRVKKPTSSEGPGCSPGAAQARIAVELPPRGQDVLHRVALPLPERHGDKVVDLRQREQRVAETLLRVRERGKEAFQVPRVWHVRGVRGEHEGEQAVHGDHARLRRVPRFAAREPVEPLDAVAAHGLLAVRDGDRLPVDVGGRAAERQHVAPQRAAGQLLHVPVRDAAAERAAGGHAWGETGGGGARLLLRAHWAAKHKHKIGREQTAVDGPLAGVPLFFFPVAAAKK